ncbi:MAG TPA: ester cyclase [Rubrobacteraceae bacterium]|nr:ester cyclase [Rubrobacteraceae bacterium]
MRSRCRGFSKSRDSSDRVTASGTQEGELFGIPPTGKSLSVEHIHWHCLADGKLVERWAVGDDLGTLIQLGIISPPGRLKDDSSSPA